MIFRHDDLRLTPVTLVFVCAAIQVMLRLDKKKKVAARAAEASSLESRDDSTQQARDIEKSEPAPTRPVA